MATERQVRAWARRNGYRLSDNHPVPFLVEMAYRDAMHAKARSEARSQS